MNKKRSTKAKPFSKPYVAPLFVGNPFNADDIAEHHAEVVAASWLAGMATPSDAISPSPKLRVLCVLPDVEVDTKVLDKIDAIHLDHNGSDRIGDIDFSDLSDADMALICSYDLVFVDAEATYCRSLVAALGYRCVVVSSKPRGRQNAATVAALLRRIGDEVELRRLQTVMPWAPPLPTVPAPSMDDAAVDAMASTK